MKPGEQPLTDADLAAAWRCMRRPATWPTTLQEALADAVRASCIRGYARWLVRFRATARPAHALPQAPVPPTPTALPTRKQPRRYPANRPGAFDARKAAANDIDD